MESENINIKFLIKIFLKNLKFILFLVLLSFLFSYLYLLFEKKYFSLKTLIHPPEIQQLMVLNTLNKKILELNSSVNLDYFKKAKKTLTTLNAYQSEALENVSKNRIDERIKTPLEEKIFIDENYVLENFFVILSSPEVFKKTKKRILENFPNIDSNKLEQIQLIKTELVEFSDRVLKSIKFVLIHPNDKELLNLTSTFLFFEANRALINKLYEIINIVESNYLSSLKSEIESTILINKEIYKNYDKYIDTKIFLLKEQIKIARSIGLENPIEGNISKDIKFSFPTTKDYLQATDTYLLGYKILENKLKTLENRVNVELLLPEYFINKNYINALNNDKKVENFTNFLELYNIKIDEKNDDIFTFMLLDGNQTFSTIQRDPKTIYLVFLIIALTLGVFISLIREIYK